jgi:hypothetical protein
MWVLLVAITLPMALGTTLCAIQGNEGPATAGSHPLHEYHSWLGACGILRQGSPSVYDPAFHAGYIKTPLFDHQSRMVEWTAALLALVCNHGDEPSLEAVAQLHSITVASVMISGPLLIALGASLAGAARWEAFISGMVSVVVFATPAGRTAVESGDLELLSGIPAFVFFIGSLAGYHRKPGPFSGVMVSTAFTMEWFVSPVVACASMPLFLFYYLRTGMRHGGIWHLGLLLAPISAALINLGLFTAWKDHWWIQVSLMEEKAFGPGAFISRIASDDRWGGNGGIMIGAMLISLGLIGSQVMAWSGRRLAGRLSGSALVGAVVFYAIVKAFHVAEMIDSVANPLSLMLIACFPAGMALMPHFSGEHRRKWTGPILLVGPLGKWAVPFVTTALMLSIGLIDWGIMRDVGIQLIMPKPLECALPKWVEPVIKQFMAGDAPYGRVLWEDRSTDRQSGWTVFMPIITSRDWIGGLSRNAPIEHLQASLRDAKLAGRVVSDWSDSELLGYIKAYRLGFVVARTSESITRWNRLADARKILTIEPENDGGPCAVFKLPGEDGLAILGQARVLEMSSGKITLADVVPDKGTVVLSLHYQKGLKTRPARVKVERELDSRDPIPLLRLRLDEPVSRLEIEWHSP